jgi:hypothetical protein
LILVKSKSRAAQRAPSPRRGSLQPAGGGLPPCHADRLLQTVVLLSNAEIDLIANLLRGIRGTPTLSAPGDESERLWRDERQHEHHPPIVAEPRCCTGQSR